jgi:mRNA interferase MazF
MPSTSVRIDEHALAVLRELAKKQRQPMQIVLTEAIESYRRHQFLEDANAAFCRLALRSRGLGRGAAGAGSVGSLDPGWAGTGMSLPKPSRGEVWFLNLDPSQGREQAGNRPALVISADRFNHGPADLVVVLPVTSQAKGIPFHVAVAPPEGDVRHLSFIKCEDVRSVSRSRLVERWVRSPPSWKPSRTGCGF